MIRVLLGASMRGLLKGILCMLAGPAFADITAVYYVPAKTFVMTVEIANNGDFRGEPAGKPGYILTRDGVDYLVVSTAKGVVVDRVEDLISALDIVADKHLDPTLLAMRKSMASNTAHMASFLAKGDDIVVRGTQRNALLFGSPRQPPTRNSDEL